MAKVKVAQFRSTRTVTVDPDATNGAVVGKNLYDEDGNLIDLNDLAAARSSVPGESAADALQAAQIAQAEAGAANAKLADIASDNILSSAEKPTVMRDYSVITSEQSGIDAQADAYSVSRTAYDSAVSALTSYLGGLTSPTAWNDKSGNTTIVGTTFRSNFNTVYTTRQTLLNAIYAAAKGLADTAQGTANLAYNPGQNVIPNPTGALGFSGLPGLVWIGGLQQQMTTLTAAQSALGVTGPMFACVAPGTSGVDQGFSTQVPWAASQPITLSANMNAVNVASGSLFIELRFLNSVGSEIDSSNRPRITAINGTGDARYSVTATPSSGTAVAEIVVRFTGALSTNTAVYWRLIKLEAGSAATPYSDGASQMGNQLTNPGSGQQVGDQRNLPPVTWASVRSVQSTPPISMSFNTATPATITFTAAAFTLYNGTGSPVSYNAASASHIQARGSTLNWFPYYRDATGAGGTQTLYLTTDPTTLATSGDVVFLGTQTVTVPSGSSGGSGGQTGGGGGSGVLPF